MEFDVLGYLENEIHAHLKAVKDDHKFTRISGLSELEGILTKKGDKFFAVDDLQDYQLLKPHQSYVGVKTFTVYICQKAKYGDFETRDLVMPIYRKAFKDIVSKMALDRRNMANGLVGFNTDRIRMYEMPGLIAGGSIGIYFILRIEEVTNVVYDANSWS